MGDTLQVRPSLQNMCITEAAEVSAGCRVGVNKGSLGKEKEGDPGQPNQLKENEVVPQVDEFPYSTDTSQPRKSPLKPESKDPWAAAYKRVEVPDNDAYSSWKDEIDKLLFP